MAQNVLTILINRFTVKTIIISTRCAFYKCDSEHPSIFKYMLCWNGHTGQRKETIENKPVGRSVVALPHLYSEYGAMIHWCAYSNRSTTALLFLAKQQIKNSPNLVNLCLYLCVSINIVEFMRFLLLDFGQSESNKWIYTEKYMYSVHVH